MIPRAADARCGFETYQSWSDLQEEAIYGLGQHQGRIANYKGVWEDLYTRNTKNAVPTAVSTAGYGIIWNSYSACRWGHPQDTRDLCDFFDLTGPDGKGSGLRATWGTSEKAPLVTFEKSLDFGEFAPTVARQPKFNGSGVVFEGYLTARESGVYQFRAKSNTDFGFQIWVDGAASGVFENCGQAGEIRFNLSSAAGERHAFKAVFGGGYLGHMAVRLKKQWKDPLCFWSEFQQSIDYYFINGQGSMDGVVKGIHDVTGPPEILPKWALGFMVSKEHYQSSRELLDCVAGYVQRKVPMDCVIQDWQYWPAACWEAEFDEKRYANAREWIGKIHAAGKRFMITIWPHFMGGVQCAWRKGMNQSWFYPHAQNDGSWYDALNPAALKGFWQEVRGICEDGIDAFWCDACEPETSLYDQSLADHEASMNPTFLGPAKEFLLPYVGQHMKGLYEGWLAEKFDRRPFFLPRAAFTGMGKYAGCPWSGDIHCTWQQQWNQMTAALNMLATGAVGAWSMDTGGFAPNVNGSEWQELQVRWHQFATFVPLMRVHGTGGHEIWSIAPNSSSAVYAALKKTIELRYRLLPYIYSCQARNYWESYTLMRWPAFDFPEDRGVWGVTDEWMFGPALLVAPVTRYLARTRNVQFPAGGWFNFWNGEYSSKSGLLEVSAPFDQCPIYVRAGSIVPLGKIIQSTAEEQRDLTILVYGGRDAQFELYEDDGISFACKAGNWSRTLFEYSEAKKVLKIGATRGPYMQGSRVFEIKFRTAGMSAPLSQRIDYDGRAQSIQLE